MPCVSERAYSLSDLKGMYSLLVEDGDTRGVCPREARTVWTALDALAERDRLAAVVEKLADNIPGIRRAAVLSENIIRALEADDGKA